MSQPMSLVTVSKISPPWVEQIFPLRSACSRPTQQLLNSILTAVVLCATSAIAQDSPQDSISISLRSEKAHYSSSDRIALTITLENRSFHDITVNKRLAHPGPDLMIDIEDAMGNHLRWLPAAPPPAGTRNDFTVLNSGQKLVLPLSGVEIGLFDKLQLDHTYRVKARYQNTEDGGKFNYAAWIGTLTSNTVSFEWKG